MSGTARQMILKALQTKLNAGVPEFLNGVQTKLKFWDEVSDFPFCSINMTGEQRDYLPAAFEWGFITASIRIYVKEDFTAADTLDTLLGKVEDVIRSNIVLTYATNKTTTDIRVVAIDTDGGLLEPLAVGEITLVIQYEVH